MFAKLAFWLVVVTGGAGAFAQYAGMAVADPNEPRNSRNVVSREQREQLGLSERNWTGVVHPDVSQAFDRLKILPEDRIERFKFLSSQRFKGTVYVQVHLKHTAVGQADSDQNKAAIAALQRRVLTSLTAAQFHPVQKFKTSPGVIGFATPEAISKLEDNPDVVGVCLDDKPIPEQLPILTKDQLPPRQPGAYADEPGVAEREVGPEVYQALDLYGQVSILAVLESKGDPLPQLTHVRSETESRWKARERAVRELQDRVLSTLTADDFILSTRLSGSPGFGGFANREGVNKLLAHPEVKSIGMEELMSHQVIPGRKP